MRLWFDRAEKGLAAAVPYAVISTSIEDHGFFVIIFLYITCWLYDYSFSNSVGVVYEK